MLDVIAELKKYRPLNMENSGDGESSGIIYRNILEKHTEELIRFSKMQFRLGQQFEDFNEETLGLLRKETENAEVYKKWALEVIGDLNRRVAENKQRTENLIFALITLADTLEMIHGFITASGDPDWILQMNRVRNNTSLVMAENDLREIGTGKYFDDSLHEAVSIIRDPEKEFREITGVEQKGYFYGDKVVRKAKVIVNTYRKEDFENEEKE